MTEDERALLIFVAKFACQTGAQQMAGMTALRHEDIGTAPSLDDCYAVLKRLDPDYRIPSIEARISKLAAKA